MRSALASLLTFALLVAGVSSQTSSTGANGNGCTSTTAPAGTTPSPPGSRGWMQITNPPTVIPASGTYTAVVNYWTNFNGLMNLHMDLSDITANYGYDGGAFAQIMGPSGGTINMQLSEVQAAGATNLNNGQSYQIHLYMTSNTNSTCYGNTNDWQNEIFDAYVPVSVVTTSFTNTMTLLNPPTTIPQSGFFIGAVQYSSNLPGYTMLHMDLNDESASYAYDGGSGPLNVTTPGSGTVYLNVSISTALTVNDTIGIHLYMASAANYQLYSAGQVNNADWNYSTYSIYYTAGVARPTTLNNTITVPNPPTAVPASGNFTISVFWSSNITGVINLHCDISDISKGYAYDAGGMTQVTGPGSGYATITTIISTANPSADSLQLHTYMLDEATSLQYNTAAGNNDWNYTLYNAYYPVGVLTASQQCTAVTNALPSPPARGWMQISNVLTTLPASGTYTAVVNYFTNFNGLMNLHMDLSDITANYGYDGGAWAQVMGPTRGVITMQLPLIVSGTGGALNVSESYQLHTYMTSNDNSTCFGNTNDWQHEVFDGYQPVSVSRAPLTNVMTLLNAPSTIPTTGYFLGTVQYQSNLAGWTMLHMDFNDETTGYSYNGGSSINVTSPGTGVVELNISISTANKMQDVIGIHLYMASAANYLQYSAGQANNVDWNYSSYSIYYTAAAAPVTTLNNTITIPNPPAAIPPAGNFTVSVYWSSNISGVINLHCDVSDITKGYAYDAGGLTQVNGPGSGYTTIQVLISTTALQTDSLQLHTYMLDEATSLQYQTTAGNNDWNYTLYNQYYPVALLTASQVCSANPSAIPSPTYRGWMDITDPLLVLPGSGTYTAAVSWRTQFPGLMNLHLDLSDITANYGYDGGAWAQVMGPGTGVINMQLPLIVSGTGATLNVSDKYQLHMYMTSNDNSTCYGNTNDWQHEIFDGYQPVTISTAPLTNSMQLLNPPTTIPQNGYFLGTVQYSSNLPGWTMLHMDFNDESNSYAYDGGSGPLNVTTPGTGVVEFNLTISTALTLMDTTGIHLYMASAYNYTTYSAGQTNNADWNHSSFSLYYTAQAAPVTTLTNSITIPSPPTTIPQIGSFNVQVYWSSNISGIINLHCDLSDITASYAYDGGSTVRVNGPGTGYANMTVTLTAQAAASDKLQLHTYMLDEATSLMYSTTAANNDWNYTLYNAYYPVTYTGSSVSTSSGGSAASTSSASNNNNPASTSSSSSSSLSGGAIAGIVIGSIVGLALLLGITCWALMGRNRGSKLNDDKMGSGGHSQHEDEVSQSAQPDEVEMGESHTNDD